MEIIFFLIAVLTAVILFIQIIKLKNRNKVLIMSNIEKSTQITDLLLESENLQIELSELAKYRKIKDLDDEALIIVKNANIEAHEILKNATEYAYIVNNDLKQKSKLNKEKSERLMEEAENSIISSVIRAKEIISEAILKADEVSNGAYSAMLKAENLKETVKAMTNIIEGYGNEYLKPSFSLLDNLGEEYNHLEAGKKYQEARKQTFTMIKSGEAATCSYVERIRRTTAINFVLDAFNGKVDSILSNVKKDNYGILERKIYDAYHIVNNNGKAFRDALITEDYLKSRLEELKWAVVFQELKWLEKEEQRIIREQIREEERAKKEYEKAIKQAEQEERLLRQLISKAQEEVYEASQQEKQKIMLRLEELEQKLKQAEERGLRAISMAQQTKAGNVYIISNIGSFGEDVFKIGMTRRLEPIDRVRELGDASVPFEFDVHAMIYSENAPSLERELHKRFMKLQLNKVNPRKEFFKVNLLQIKEVIEELGISVKWTMMAEAKQFKESLLLTEAMKSDKELEDKWEKFQEEAEDNLT